MQSTDFRWLFFALLLFLIGIPIADDLDSISRPVARAMAFSALLGIGVWSLRSGGWPYVMARALALFGAVASIAASAIDSPFFIYSSFLGIIGFLITAIVITFYRVATDTDINTNRITGAIVVYLLLGVFWAVAYSVVEVIWPGSVSGFDMGARDEWDSEWLYFSFVTMTTLGYGDIVPVTAVARMLAYMQAAFGQFYIAILVAGLVGAYVGRND